MDAIELYEGNGGQLLIWDPSRKRGYSELEHTESHFAADAAALADNDVSDWTVDRLDEPPAPDDLVAIWTPDGVTIVGQLGLAARGYLAHG